MRRTPILLLATLLYFAAGVAIADEQPVATREFEIKNDRPYLGGKPVELWGAAVRKRPL